MNPDSNFPFQPTLMGRTLTLRPLEPLDLEPLFAVASDPLIWELHPEPTRYQRPVFERFFAKAVASDGALIAVENRSGRIVGSSRFYEWNPEVPDISIGYSFLSRDCWGKGVNAEMKGLMLDHAFAIVQTVWFHVGRENRRSRRAVERIGGRFSHEGLRALSGPPIPYVYYRIDRDDWKERMEP